MADEITILSKGNGVATVLLLFAIATPYTREDPEGGPDITIAPTPMDAGSLEASYITAAEVTAINAGTKAWKVLTFHPDPALTNPQLLTVVQGLHASCKTALDAELANRYWKNGQRFDAS